MSTITLHIFDQMDFMYIYAEHGSNGIFLCHFCILQDKSSAKYENDTENFADVVDMIFRCF